MRSKRIAFCGFAGCGKDEAAKPLYAADYVRHCFGDIIKSQLDGVIRCNFGFSAFTENRQEKAQIRRTLESWGEDNYDAILAEFTSSLPDRAVNTRLVRVREAKAWKEAGGIIIQIVRPATPPATQWEADRFAELEASGLIDNTILNVGKIADLHADVSNFIA